MVPLTLNRATLTPLNCTQAAFPGGTSLRSATLVGWGMGAVSSGGQDSVVVPSRPQPPRLSVVRRSDDAERGGRIEPVKERPLRAAEKLRLACDLFEAGVDLMRQKLRREHPALPAPEIELLLAHWLSTRPGAEHGDAVGRPRNPAEPAA